MVMVVDVMTEGRGVTSFLGLRVLKTGAAATLSVYLSGFVPYSLPLLAGVAAVICLQPSISAGVQKGLTRIQATLFGGLLGLLFHYLFGAHALMMGIAVVIAIRICNWLQWEDGVALASITVIVIMSQVSGEAVPYAVGRVVSTLIGIVVAAVTNILVAPPRHLITFRDELRRLTTSFPELYRKAVEAYAANDPELGRKVLEELGEADNEVGILQRELKHLEGAQTRYGVFLEGIEFREYILFDRGVHFLHEVMDKIEDLVEVTRRRYKRKQDLLRQGALTDPNFISPEFQELLQALEELAVMLGKLHQCVFRLVGEGEVDLMPRISSQAREIHLFQDRVRQRLRNWEIEFIHKLDIFFLMSAHRIIFDLEEIAGALTGLAKAVVAMAGEEKEMVGEEENNFIKGEV